MEELMAIFQVSWNYLEDLELCMLVCLSNFSINEDREYGGLSQCQISALPFCKYFLEIQPVFMMPYLLPSF